LAVSEKIALVSGGNRGIGREVVAQLARMGFLVYIGARDFEAGKKAAKEMGNGKVLPVQLDVADPQSVKRAVDVIRKEHGRLDVLINNAGTMYDSWQSGVDADIEKSHQAFETNFFGAWRLAKAVIPLLKKGEQGRIVNVSSEAGSLAVMGGGTPAYSTSKAALNALTRILASELKTEGILVNSVCPGWVRTEMGGKNAPRSVEQGAASVLWAATLPAGGPTGGFFRDGKRLEW
jgi:NAD(P)-dependent dehydrogenase (short-subunit alcohol dehydrogenase family)